MSPNIDERAIRDPDPFKLTLKLAHAKAEALLSQITKPSILVTGDQVVYFQGQILEKPDNEQHARELLRGYRGQYVEVINGVVVVNTQTGKRAETNDVIKIHFNEFPDEVIETLVREGDAMYCAGALKVEHPALSAYTKSRTGTDDSLMGIPVEPVRELVLQLMQGK